jgi:hypothetical protein
MAPDEMNLLGVTFLLHCRQLSALGRKRTLGQNASVADMKAPIEFTGLIPKRATLVREHLCAIWPFRLID